MEKKNMEKLASENKCADCYFYKRLTCIKVMLEQIKNLEFFIDEHDIKLFEKLIIAFENFEENIGLGIGIYHDYHIDTMEKWNDTTLFKIWGDGKEHL